MFLLCATQIIFPIFFYMNSKFSYAYKNKNRNYTNNSNQTILVNNNSTLSTNNSNKNIVSMEIELQNIEKKRIENSKIEDSNTENTNNIEENIWSIEIPKINLIAPIEDGTDSETLNRYVGHFEESGYESGNICLAAHNRGYKVNYFKNIKVLQYGDEIIYRYKNLKLTYIVIENKIINDTDVEVIENTEEDKITLITCVENEPSKRRSIEGKLKD